MWEFPHSSQTLAFLYRTHVPPRLRKISLLNDDFMQGFDFKTLIL
ncbi:hypothetical protein LEP1GSC070_2309 [Leptospira santarosai str. AIM]|nr:hypothetical protein LEP1GSC070_2309 [Leptospira santarosai str. AIM]